MCLCRAKKLTGDIRVPQRYFRVICVKLSGQWYAVKVKHVLCVSVQLFLSVSVVSWQPVRWSHGLSLVSQADNSHASTASGKRAIHIALCRNMYKCNRSIAKGLADTDLPPYSSTTCRNSARKMSYFGKWFSNFLVDFSFFDLAGDHKFMSVLLLRPSQFRGLATSLCIAATC